MKTFKSSHIIYLVLAGLSMGIALIVFADTQKKNRTRKFYT